jgi:hypothetical protein
MPAQILIATTMVVATVSTLAGCSSSSPSDSPAWTLAQSSPSASTVVVQYFYGSCESLSGAAVKRTASSVEITLQSKSAKDACNDALHASYVRVRLGGVLGNRHILGACQPSDHGTCQPVTSAAIPTNLREVGP